LAVVDVVGFWALRLWKRQLLFEGKLCHSVLIKTLTQSHSPSHSLKCTCTHIYIHIHTHWLMWHFICAAASGKSSLQGFLGLFFGISFI